MNDPLVQFIDSEGNPLPDSYRPQMADRAKVQIGDRTWICRVTKLERTIDTEMVATLVPEELDKP